MIIDVSKTDLNMSQYQEIIQAHGRMKNETLCDLLLDMVKIHVELEIDHQEKEPLVGVSPCVFASVLWELLERRYQSGALVIDPRR